MSVRLLALHSARGLVGASRLAAACGLAAACVFVAQPFAARAAEASAPASPSVPAPPTAAAPAPAAAPGDEGPPPIDLRSETLVVEHGSKRAIFGGGVTAVRGQLVLRCPSVTATYDAASRVEKVVCDGPVTASQGARTMTAGTGVFDNVKGTLTLRGEPTLVEGERRLTGEELVFHVATEHAELVRARAQFPAGDAGAAARIAGRGPLTVSAERVTYDLREHTTTFGGGVVATRGDLTLRASRLVTTHGEDGNVERAVTAGGPVSVTQRDRLAKAGRATFLAGKSRLVLEGEPTLQEGESTLAGDKVTFALADDRVEVERPRATFPLKKALPGGKR